MEKLAVSEQANQPIPEDAVSDQPQGVESPPPQPAATPEAPAQPPTQLVEQGRDERPLQETIKQEVGKAWQFTKDKVFPAILDGVTWLVDRLDPPMATLGSKIAQMVQSNPNWTKLTESKAWKQVSTVALSITRSLGEVWGKATANLTVSDRVRHIASKKAALTTLLVVLLLFLLLKPSPAPKVVKAPSPAPAKAPVASVSKTQVPVAVQKQILAITQTYGENLIQHMEANSQAGRLVLELSEAWYQMTTDQQDQLAQELFAAGQKLRFPVVILADSTNHLIARPATVGKSIVILRR
jgi:hypothetical protein